MSESRKTNAPLKAPTASCNGCCRAADQPWWFAAPKIFVTCLWLLFLPLRAVAWVADAAVAIALLGFFVVGWMWWNGAIPDAAVTAFLGQLGERVLGLAKAAGAL